jgi:hypothetical protein
VREVPTVVIATHSQFELLLQREMFGSLRNRKALSKPPSDDDLSFFLGVQVKPSAPDGVRPKCESNLN